MTPLLAAGCVLQIVETRLDHDATRWTEHTTYEVGAAPGCAHVTLPLAPQAEWLEVRARTRYGDGSRQRLGPERFATTPRGAGGEGAVTVHVPELLEGDRLILDVTRAWHQAELTWAPGGPNLAILHLPTGVTPQVEGGELRHDRAHYAQAPGPELRATVVPDGPFTPVPLPTAPPAGDLAVGERLSLEVPRGNPQLLLYPGAGSQVRIDRFLTFPASSLPQGASFPVAADQEARFAVEPDGAATFERGPDHAVVTVRPTEGPVKVSATWAEADAPTYGERRPGHELIVDAPEGSVGWEGAGWHLLELRKAPVLPNARLLVKALDHRFRAVAIPEPGLPNDLRGSAPSWELAALLRPTLHERARPGLPGDPLWPRRLVKARKSQALTSTEAALILWLYARQAGLRADWALARPASQGPGYTSTPAGYTHGLVRLGSGDDVRWVDPSCAVCGPFELPPDLEGADVLSPAAVRTPDPTPGRAVLVDDGTTLTWRLAGPAALALRLDLEAVDPDARADGVAQRVGGPGATLAAIEGLDRAGQPIVATVTPGDGLRLDPLALPAAGPDGTHWVPWVGTRARRGPTDDDPGPAELEEGPLTYRRTVADGVVEEVLEIRERTLPGPLVRRLEVLRRGVAQPPPAEQPAP